MSVNIPSSFFSPRLRPQHGHHSLAVLLWISSGVWSTTRAGGDRSSLDERPDLDHQIGDGGRPTWDGLAVDDAAGAAVIPSRELVMLTNGG
jgi:hypothetical protein